MRLTWAQGLTLTLGWELAWTLDSTRERTPESALPLSLELTVSWRLVLALKSTLERTPESMPWLTHELRLGLTLG
ncbi:hypothetical protein AB0C27_06395 [Nonomuraea sp. NPDC048882]|uniref:hypothetical protein n=1 Tax=Nonomuraea sp. NPDC048882 TaxID=3154347 RepID=UPI0033E4B552